MKGKEFKEIREELGITQKEISELLTLSRSFVSLMENDKRSISHRTELAINYLILVERMLKNEK